MNKRSKPFFMTVVILIFISSVLTLARLSLKYEEKNSALVCSDNLILDDTDGLNESEKQVIRKISSFIPIPDNQRKREFENQNIYINFLKKYLSSPGINLSKTRANEVKNLINDRDELMKLEKKVDISEMSFDGKKAATYILTQIYEMCGMKPVINMNGEIEKISDQSGDIIYIKRSLNRKEGFRAEGLVISFTVIFALLCICYILSSKKQIYEKGGIYDGFNKKEAA